MKNILLRAFLLLLSVFPLIPISLSAQYPGGVSNGLTLWVRADTAIYSNAGTTPSVDGSTVQQWNNNPLLGAYNFSQAGATKRPKYYSSTPLKLFNFNPLIEFDNTGGATDGDKLGLTTLGTNLFSQTELSVFMAQRLRTTAYTQVWFKWQDCYDSSCPTSDRVGFENSGTNLRFDVLSNGTGSNNVGNPAGFDITTYRAVTSVWAASSRANAVYGNAQGGSRIRIDGSEGTTVTANAATANFATSRELAIGSNNDLEDTYYSNLDISEVIIYKRGLITAERDRVDTYLGLKYGLSLFHNYVNSNGTVTWRYTLNPIYNFGIIGLARDDASSLMQKQSKSMSRLVNASTEFDIVTMYLAGLAINNKSNTGTFASGDTSFFIIGSNRVTPMAMISTENPTGASKTLNREWLSQQFHFTNNDISLEFDFSANPSLLAVTGCQKIAFIMDTDGNFSNATILTDAQASLVKTGNKIKVTIPYSQFLSLPYFTFALVNGDDTASSVVVQPKCFGDANGSIAINIPTGAAAPLTYSMNGGAYQASNTFSPLGAGTYYPTVRDNNGCLYKDTLVITEPADMTVTGNTIMANCFGQSGKAYVQTISNGITPYTYSWDTGATTDTLTTVAGTHKVVITDSNGCKDSVTVTVTEPNRLDIDTVVTAASCPLVANGRIVASASGGTTPYTFNRNTGAYGASGTFSSLLTGTYLIHVKDAKGCLDSASVFIAAGPTPIVDAPNDTAVCSGARVTLSGSGTAPITYAWTNGISNGVQFTATVTRTYVLTGTDPNGCKSTDSTTVTVNPAPSVVIATPPAVICSDTSTIQLTATPAGGTWRGTGITDTDQGIFSPAVSGVGNFNVIYDYTDQNGCKEDDTVQVRITARKNATVNPAGPFCTNAGIQQLTTAQPGGTWSGPGIDATGKFDPAAAGTGSHTITYIQSGTCPDTGSIVILVNSVFNAQITPDGPFCVSADTVQLLSITPGASWSGNGITDASIGVFDPRVAGVGTHTITHTISGTCGTTDTEQFVVLPLDTAHIILPNDSICHDAGIMQLSADRPGGTWGGAVNAAGEFDPSGKTPGTYKVYYTYFVTCAYTDSATITIADTLIINLPNATVPCFGDQTGSMQVTATRGPTPYRYSWTDDATATSATRTNLPQGSYTTQVTDALGCSAQATATITQPSQLLIGAVTTVNDSCFQAGKGNVVAPASGGTPLPTGGYTYTLNPANGVLNANRNGFDGLIAGSYTLTVRDQNNCSATYPFIITEPALLTVTASGQTDYCSRSVGSTQVDLTQGGTLPYTYRWNNNVTTTTNPGVLQGTYTITVTDRMNCVATDTALVGNVPAPTITATPTDVTCWLGSDGQATTVVSGGTGTKTITWSDGLAPNSPTRSNFRQGSYSVQVVDAQQCSATAPFVVNQPTDIFINSVPNTILCYQQSYTGTFTANGGNGAAFTYYLNDTVTPAAYNLSNSGSYTLYATDRKGCYSDTTTFQIGYSPLIVAGISADVTVCRFDPVTFTGSGSGGNGNFSYTWDNASTPSSATNTYQTTATTAASTQVRLIVADGCSKPDTIFANYFLHPDPVATLDYTPLSGCIPLDVNYTVGGNLTQYTVDAGDGTLFTTTPAFSNTFPNAGSYQPTLSGETVNGCRFTLPLGSRINVYGYPVADFSWTPQFPTIIDNNVNFINLSTGASSYKWTGTDSTFSVFFTSVMQNPIVPFPQEIGDYDVQLIAISGFGCEDTSNQVVSVKDELLSHVPTAFSPDEDGVNEEFRPIFSTPNINRYELLIFDRWGEQIFRSTDPNEGWNGLYLGLPAQNDVYVFRLKFALNTEAKLRNVFGKVMLLR